MSGRQSPAAYLTQSEYFPKILIRKDKCSSHYRFSKLDNLSPVGELGGGGGEKRE